VNLNKLAKLLEKISKKDSLQVLSLTKLVDYGENKGKYIALIVNNCKELSKIVLDGIELEDVDTNYIVEIITLNSPNLTYIDLSFNKFKLTNENIVTSFIKNTWFKTIILKGLELDEYIPFLVTSLENCKHLEHLDISNNKVGSFINSFNNLFYFGINIKVLGLNSCDLFDEYFAVLLEILAENQNLIELSVNSNEITNMSAQTIVVFFSTNKALKKLSLLKNKIYEKDLTSLLDEENMNKCLLDNDDEHLESELRESNRSKKRELIK